MTKFPQAKELPTDVNNNRLKRNQEVLKAIKIGITCRLFVIGFELLGYIYIQSSSIFLDAISHCTDIISSLFLLICVRLAQRPPDLDHPFGHGRYEPLGGLLLGVSLSVMGGVMVFQQMMAFFTVEEHRHIYPWAWLFPAISLCILEIAYQFLKFASRRSNSPALAADAYHFRIDSCTSLLATLALVIAALQPEASVLIDHIGATVIGMLMIILGILATRINFHQLMDKVPNSSYFAMVKAAALKANGVEGTEKIRIQLYGPDAHVDIDIEVKPTLTVYKAHKISQDVRLEIQKAWPAVRDVTVHIEPYYANDH